MVLSVQLVVTGAATSGKKEKGKATVGGKTGQSKKGKWKVSSGISGRATEGAPSQSLMKVVGNPAFFEQIFVEECWLPKVGRWM
jgi:hypothetical protein